MSLLPPAPGSISRSNLRVLSGNSTGIPLPGSARALPSKWAALDAEATALAAGTVLAPAPASAPSPLPSALPGPRYAASPAAAPAPAPAALPGARYGGEAPPEMAQGLRALRSRISSSRALPPPQRAASPLSSGASYFAVSPAAVQQQQQRARAPRAASTNSTVSSCAHRLAGRALANGVAVPARERGAFRLGQPLRLPLAAAPHRKRRPQRQRRAHPVA